MDKINHLCVELSLLEIQKLNEEIESSANSDTAKKLVEFQVLVFICLNVACVKILYTCYEHLSTKNASLSRHIFFFSDNSLFYMILSIALLVTDSGSF